MKCDFCSSGEPPVATFGCGTFEYVDAVLGNVTSEGSWKACETCAALVRAQAWDRLMDRAIGTFQIRHGRVPGLRNLVIILHKGFREHRLEVQ